MTVLADSFESLAARQYDQSEVPIRAFSASSNWSVDIERIGDALLRISD
jgi:hypothetical protein